MKKYFIIFITFLYLLFFIPLGFTANSKTFNTDISKLETELFGFDYNNENVKTRLSRLEKYIYGSENSGDITARIKRISGDTNLNLIGKEIQPKEDTFEEVDNIADSTVSYPVVDEIEKKIFGKTYQDRDFHTRIVTIERKLFNKIYDVEDYSNRMDRIKAEVMPERLAREKVFGYDNSNSLTQNDLSGINSSRFSSVYGQENYTRPYANYGEYQGLLGEAAPINSEDLNADLTQLEYATVGTEFSNEDTKTRIKRLNSVNKAQKNSSKYDSQKFNQRMSTVMEIGAMLLMILAMVL